LKNPHKPNFMEIRSEGVEFFVWACGRTDGQIDRQRDGTKLSYF